MCCTYFQYNKFENLLNVRHNHNSIVFGLNVYFLIAQFQKNYEKLVFLFI